MTSEAFEEKTWRYDGDNFVQIAPLLMYLKHAFGERCWHTPHHYANLTIDDPWLIEPYGYLSFNGLLEEMEKNNFHTTIAFIPWNFDRGRKKVIQLFLDHPHRFSIAVHGNNHDHKEFYRVKTDHGDLLSAPSLNAQEQNIRQALARMEAFRSLTGITYDPVMIFPHEIGPRKIIWLLNKYNFLATVNSGLIPVGEDRPSDPLFGLRSLTTKFENFLTVQRFSTVAAFTSTVSGSAGRAGRKTLTSQFQAQIAINLFLDNPLLFYAHHDFFKDGIDSFSGIVRVVNMIDPTVEWRSLGHVARHAYYLRLKNDGNYDVLAFTKSVAILNKRKTPCAFSVRKEDSSEPLIKQVTVNGLPHPFGRSGGYLQLSLDIPGGEVGHVDIEYANDFDLAATSLSSNSPRIFLLRMFSDFRDLVLSKNVLTQSVVGYYYSSGLYDLGLIPIGIITLFIISVIIILCVRIRNGGKNKLRGRCV